MRKGIKITIIIFCIVIAIFVIDSAQALIFNSSPLIKVRKYYDGGTLHYKDGGLFVDTYCGVNGVKDTVIKGFSYSLTFDEKNEIIDKTKESNITCDTALEKFYEDAENTYYYSCIKSEYVIVKYSDGSQETVEEALAKEKIKISDLDKFDIHYIKESKNIKEYVYKSGNKEASLLISATDNKFTFNYSLLSSYWAIGTYEENDGNIILKTNDGLNKYTFKKQDDKYIFVEEKSSPLPKYKYSQNGESEVCVPDGAVFQIQQ